MLSEVENAARATVLENARLRAEIERLRAALVKVEAVMSIVEPRSDKAEYIETLRDVREALGWDRATGRASPTSA